MSIEEPLCKIKDINLIDEELATTEINFEKSCCTRYFAPLKSGSLRGSIITIANLTFGGGFLVFPIALAQCGPIIGFVIFVFVALISYYTLSLLFKYITETKIYDYNKLVEISLGSKMVTFSNINNLLICIGSIMSYLIIIYNFILEICIDFFGIESNDKNKLIIMIINIIIIQIPMICLKDISIIQYTSLIGLISLIYCIILILIEMPFYIYEYTENKQFPSMYKELNWGYLDTFSTFLFGFSSHNCAIEILSELKDPSQSRNNKVLHRSYMIEIIVYFLIAYGGFFSTFYDTPQIFFYRDDLRNFDSDHFVKIAKIALALTLYTTLAIGNCNIRSSIKMLFYNGKNLNSKSDFMLMFFIFLVSNITVYFISNVVDIIGIMGGFCTVILSFVNPILIHIDRSNLKKTHPKNLLRYSLLFVIIILGFMATINSIINII